jgi:hypothetical protein
MSSSSRTVLPKDTLLWVSNFTHRPISWRSCTGANAVLVVGHYKSVRHSSVNVTFVEGEWHIHPENHYFTTYGGLPERPLPN